MPFISRDEKMMVFSKAAIEDLLDHLNSSSSSAPDKSGNINTTASATVSVELRGETTTLSSGSYTLEWALACPPSCP